jgi:transposase
MRTGRPMAGLTVTAEERETLERWARRRSTAQATALRARIVLASAAGRTNTAIARETGVKKQTVGKWRTRFLAKRLDGLLDEPRPGAPRTITDADVERVVTLTLESAPRDATHWSTRSMASRAGLSQTAISRIWRAFALQPHRTETFKLSPVRPGQIERRTHDHIRYGTTSLFAALDVKSGKVIGQCHRRHRAIEFRKFLERIEAEVPAALTSAEGRDRRRSV